MRRFLLMAVILFSLATSTFAGHLLSGTGRQECFPCGTAECICDPGEEPGSAITSEPSDTPLYSPKISGTPSGEDGSNPEMGAPLLLLAVALGLVLRMALL